MFKLILHHTYRANGEAVDISHNENHGFRTAASFVPDGISAGSGALQFAGGPSRVRVTTKPTWQQPRALKIETWVRLTALGQRRNLVEGALSFAFFIHPDGVLWGTFLGPATPGGASTWHGANSKDHAPDGVTRTVPLNQWVKLTYLHDGIASIRLYIDDQLVAANYKLVAAVPSVGPDGVHIGHWPGDDRYTFHGEIDEVKIWKYDPEVPYKQFFCRPMTSEQMACWREVFDNMTGLLAGAETGRQFIAFMRCIDRAQRELVRAIRSNGEDTIEANNAFARRYRELWCSGKIDGPEMEAFIAEWLKWLQGLPGGAFDAYRRRVEGCWREFGHLKLNQLAAKIADCDPAFAAYIRMIYRLVEQPPPPPRGLGEVIKAIIEWLLGLIRRLFGQRK